MKLLKETLAEIKPLDARVMDKVRSRLDSLTKPAGSLGCLEEMVIQFAGITGREKPEIPRKCMVLTAADHGVARLGISAYPRETTMQMLRNYLLSKGAAANVLADHCGADLVVVDMGVAGDSSTIPGLLQRKIAPGTQDFTKGPAMTRAQAVSALETGIALVRAQVKKGYRLFTVGEMGIGNTTASAAILAAFTGMTAEAVTGRGTGISDQRLSRKRDAVRAALQMNKPDPRDGLDVLAKVGGFELGGLAGVMLGAAAMRSMVVVDGFNAGAAAMVAQALQPGCGQYLLGSHISAEEGHRGMIQVLGLHPCIDLGLRLGEAVGASLVANFLDAAIKLLHEMATFEDANVTKSAEE